VDQALETSPITITIVQRQQGAEFDRTLLKLPGGAFTIWVNQTETSQVILPLAHGLQGVITLAPRASVGSVWKLRS